MEMIIVSAGDPALPVARAVGDRADRDHPDLGAAGVHPDVLHGHHGPTSCRSPASRSRSACWWTAPSSRWRTPTTRSTSGSAGGRKGDFHAGAARGAEGGRAVGLLLAAGDRRRVPADLRAGRPGGAAVPAARLLEEPGDGARGAARDHARSGAAHDSSRAWSRSRFRPRWLARARQRGRRSAATTPRSATRSAACCSRLYEPACRFVLRHRALTVIAGRAWRWSRRPCRCTSASAPSSCRRSTKASILYMPTTLPGISVDRGAAHAADPGPHPARLPRGRARLRQGGPRRLRRPIRRRSRWSRPPSC